VRAVDAFKGLDCGSFDPEKSDHIHGRAQARLWGGDFRGVKVRGCEACVFGERYQHTCGRARPVRCSVCGWPMAATVQEGCVPGQASLGCARAADSGRVPEIYIPRNHKMWFDISRSDAAYAGAAAVNYPMTFGGMKVLHVNGREQTKAPSGMATVASVSIDGGAQKIQS